MCCSNSLQFAYGLIWNTIWYIPQFLLASTIWFRIFSSSWLLKSMVGHSRTSPWTVVIPGCSCSDLMNSIGMLSLDIKAMSCTLSASDGILYISRYIDRLRKTKEIDNVVKGLILAFVSAQTLGMKHAFIFGVCQQINHFLYVKKLSQIWCVRGSFLFAS